MHAENKEKIGKIYEVLPKLNCGLCGFGNCGKFARAVVERRASPFGCRQNPWSGHRISEIVGGKVPAHSYGFQPASVSRLRANSFPTDLKPLREEVKESFQGVDDILARIENLKARK